MIFYIILACIAFAIPVAIFCYSMGKAERNAERKLIDLAESVWSDTGCWIYRLHAICVCEDSLDEEEISVNGNED